MTKEINQFKTASYIVVVLYILSCFIENIFTLIVILIPLCFWYKQRQNLLKDDTTKKAYRESLKNDNKLIFALLGILILCIIGMAVSEFFELPAAYGNIINILFDIVICASFLIDTNSIIKFTQK